MIHAALDVNRDGRVDFNDGVIIGQGMRRSQRHPLDLNGDGRVDYRGKIFFFVINIIFFIKISQKINLRWHYLRSNAKFLQPISWMVVIRKS